VQAPIGSFLACLFITQPLLQNIYLTTVTRAQPCASLHQHARPGMDRGCRSHGLRVAAALQIWALPTTTTTLKRMWRRANHTSSCTSSLDDGNDDATLHHPAPDLCLRVLYVTGMNDASNESNKTRRRLAMCRLVDARYRRRSIYRDPQCLFVFSAILTVLYIHLAKTSLAPHLNPSVFAHSRR